MQIFYFSGKSDYNLVAVMSIKRLRYDIMTLKIIVDVKIRRWLFQNNFGPILAWRDRFFSAWPTFVSNNFVAALSYESTK